MHFESIACLDENSSEEHIVKRSESGNRSRSDIRAGSINDQEGIMVTRTFEVSPINHD